MARYGSSSDFVLPLEDPQEGQVGQAKPEPDGQLDQDGPGFAVQHVAEFGADPVPEFDAVPHGGVARRQDPVAA